MTLSELLKWSFQDLVLINDGVHFLSVFQFKKTTWSYSILSKCLLKHLLSTKDMFSIIITVRIKLFTIPFPYLVPSAVLYVYFYTHLIFLNKGLLILFLNKGLLIVYSEISIAPGKLKIILAVKFLQKRSTMSV